MAYFDLDKYMTAEERIELFAKENPDFRMKSFYEVSEGFVFVQVELFRTWADEHPWISGLAGESLATQFAIEKAETSAYARCISNSGDPKYSTRKDGSKAPRPNRAEMEKVSIGNAEPVKPMYGKVGSKSAAIEMALRTDIKNNPWSAPEAKAEPAQWQVEDVAAALGGEVLDVTYECAHGKMIRREGTSAKTNRPYYGFVCTEKSKADQCEPKWGTLTANGKWSFGEQDK
jgi:hypothetical protein